MNNPHFYYLQNEQAFSNAITMTKISNFVHCEIDYNFNFYVFASKIYSYGAILISWVTQLSFEFKTNSFENKI